MIDIIPNKKSNFPDKGRKGVIDLRHFNNEKRAKIQERESERKNVLEIIKIKKEQKEFSKQEAISENNFCYSDKTYNSEKEFKTKAPNLLPKIEFSAKPKFGFSLLWQKSFLSFILVVVIISLTIFSLSFVQNGIEEKGRILGASTQAYGYLRQAGQSISNQNFESSIDDFNSAKLNFSNIKTSIENFGIGISGTIGNLPIDTPISTATNLASAGENISSAGEKIALIFEKISKLKKKNILINSSQNFQTDINKIALDLKNAENNLNKIDLKYIPKEFQKKIELSKKELPVVASNFEKLSKDFQIIGEILGSNRSQKYLILFQNNSEMRATGGFIGSYGILDLENGQIKDLSINGIYDADGQLNEKIVPPMPIQKISTEWSMHDANWFPDFPTSAKKVALFYEKTGGPTVDGVIAIDSNVIEKILGVTGPIEMQKYGTVINKKNFLTQTQLQVEKLYNKKENKPKKFLSDLAPKIIEKLFAENGLGQQKKIQKYLSFIDIIEESLKEKDIMFYHRNSEIESIIKKRGWGGQMLHSKGDYLSIVNNNINGYKTDAVIDEQIFHNTEILSDGSIIDTVKIVRKHLGGDSNYDWYNRVNSDYMKVYVPLGSTLLEAKGYTAQKYEPPIDYRNFETDPDVKKIEDTIKIDPDSGTYISEESGKTVFGNWVYVSPNKTVEVTYKYKLPYKINFDSFTKPADKYSILVQKQSGSKGSGFMGTIKIPNEWKTIWRSQGLNIKTSNENIIKTNLKTDKIYGIVFEENDIGN